jgi:hypothetical protein
MRITVVGAIVIISAIVTALLVLHHFHTEISNAKYRVDAHTRPDADKTGSQPLPGETR